MKNILITRPKEQGKEIADLLEWQGFATFIEPLFSVEKTLLKQKFSKQISAIIITSANACENIINSDFPKNIKIFAVGKKTAQKLIEAGFENIVFPKTNSAIALKNLIAKTHKDKTGLILYFHGSIMSLDFAKALEKYDLKVQNICAYETHEMKNFSAEFLKFAKKNPCNQVLIFSQNSAKIFFNLAKKHNLLEYFSHSQILCLSDKILRSVKKFGFKKVKTFAEIPILKNFYD